MVHKYKYLKTISPATREFIKRFGKTVSGRDGGPLSERQILSLVKTQHAKFQKLERYPDYEEQLSEIINNILPDLLSNPEISRELKWEIFPKEMQVRQKRRDDFRRRHDEMSMGMAREYGREMVPKEIRQHLVRTAALEELCGDLQDGTAPSVEMHELAGLLGVDISKIKDKRSACSALRHHLEALTI